MALLKEMESMCTDQAEEVADKVDISLLVAEKDWRGLEEAGLLDEEDRLLRVSLKGNNMRKFFAESRYTGRRDREIDGLERGTDFQRIELGRRRVNYISTIMVGDVSFSADEEIRGQMREFCSRDVISSGARVCIGKRDKNLFWKDKWLFEECDSKAGRPCRESVLCFAFITSTDSFVEAIVFLFFPVVVTNVILLLQATLDESLYELAGELVRFLLRSGREYESTTPESDKLSPRFLGYFLFPSAYRKQSFDSKSASFKELSAHIASVKNILENHASYLMSEKELSKLVAFVKGTQFDLVEYLQRERLGSARLENFASGLELIAPNEFFAKPIGCRIPLGAHVFCQVQGMDCSLSYVIEACRGKYIDFHWKGTSFSMMGYLALWYCLTFSAMICGYGKRIAALFRCVVYHGSMFRYWADGLPNNEHCHVNFSHNLHLRNTTISFKFWKNNFLQLQTET
ncbi:hypothetical protein Taro_029625 [Colocasia esculenta]|uniref:Uncharacterized protein n=1 Tax=Colocasia esculenta TaxID=4460 RepID=A0A843VLU9_COLES|nr:hypothetical protein [Colocasia esculenta]